MHVNNGDKKDMEIRRPWLSATSLGPPVPTPQMNFQENQANKPGQVYWFGSQNFPSNSAQHNQAENMIQFSGSISEANSGESGRNFANWEAAVAGQLGITSYNVKNYRDLIMGAASGLQNVSHENLTALVNAAPAKSMASNSLGFSPPYFDSTSSSVIEVPVKYISDASEIPCHHPYDLNVPFAITEEDSTLNFEFAPITPGKPSMAKSRVTLDLPAAVMNPDKLEKITTTTEEIDPNEKDISNCASNADVSTTIQVNENCDDGGSRPVELNNVTPDRKPKRRKHRPKVITTDGKAKKTPKPVTPEPAGTKVTKPAVKRKYARKKPVAKTPTSSSSSPLEETEQAVEKQLKSIEKSSKRRLNFDMEEEIRDEGAKSSTKSTDGQQSSVQAQLPTESQLPRDLDIIIPSHKQAPSTPLASKPRGNRGGRRKKPDTENLYTGEHIANFHNSTVHLTIPSVPTSPPKDLNNGGRGQGEKRKRKIDDAMQQTETDISNISGYHYNTLYAYQNQMISWTPLIYKKRRSEKVQVSSSYSTSSASKANNWVFPLQIGDLTTPASFEVGRINLEALIQTERSTKKRSKGPTRVRDLSSLSGFADCKMQFTLPGGQNSATHNGCVEALKAELHPTLTKKKRTKKNTLYNSSFSKLQWHQFSLGAPSSIDEITERFMHLDINRETRLFYDHMPYFVGDHGEKALVVYRQDGTMVPFNPIRKRKPRPKVDLDDETNRVWKLLLADINSEGIDGTDEEKTKWWEGERSVFQGRAESFIARMRLVQGDRRFSPWKGSVLDSVIGVFLTQNVSDHLSSSAFMALAAHFPLKSSNCHTEFYEGESSVVNEQAMTLFNSVIFNQSFCDQGSVTTQEIRIESPESSNGAVSPTFESPSKQLSSSNKEINEAGIEHSSCDSSKCHTSFTKLLQMAESNGLTDEISVTEQSVLTAESVGQNKLPVTVEEAPLFSGESCINFQLKENTDFSGVTDVTESNSVFNDQNNFQQKTTVSNLTKGGSVTDRVMKATAAKEKAKAKAKAKRVGKELRDDFDWKKVKKEAEEVNGKKERSKNTMDSLDWEAVRCADVNEIAETIKERGMNNMLAERIKAFLNKLVQEYGSTDLEWLRNIQPDLAKEFLLSIKGLGLKSVECVRLLTLHHLAFPVDTNVGRIAVRLGWVPLQPLPESLQLHLLELYPVLETIQKYLWPRLCKLDQKTLYELHYQLITFGKVFCTKSKPNCNACPMRGECRHFASAFASARLSLPGPEEKRIVIAPEGSKAKQENFSPVINEPHLSLTQAPQQVEGNEKQETNYQVEKHGVNGSCEPIIEVPLSPEPEPEPEPEQLLEHDIEDGFYEDPNEIPTIKLNMKEFAQNVQNYMQRNMELEEGEVSKALVSLNIEAASIPTPKLKNVSQLRTEHHVYELPDNHPLLKGLDKRELDDPCSYLLAIWTPGETASSIEPPERKCSAQEYGKLCDDQTCFSCNSVKEANSQIVRGTLLIPCRTAMRGSFPLNGTYFQVNEVFADHDSSLEPLAVPRSLIWNLPRRTVYFGTSIPTIFKGLSTQAIQHCFWKGFVCVRGFDQKSRAPRPLMARLHFPASSRSKAKGRTAPNGN